MLRPKSKGAGIMVSDFLNERHGYLALTDEEHSEAIKVDPSIKKQPRLLLEYGENRDGYFTSEKFMHQMKDAVKIAEIKYKKSDGWRHVWVFDQSSCHKAMAEDALDASKMNVKPGGKQPRMHTTVWAGNEQAMCLPDGTPKGMKLVLEERGINTASLIRPQMEVTLDENFTFLLHNCCVKTVVYVKYSDTILTVRKVTFVIAFHAEDRAKFWMLIHVGYVTNHVTLIYA